MQFTSAAENIPSRAERPVNDPVSFEEEIMGASAGSSDESVKPVCVCFHGFESAPMSRLDGRERTSNIQVSPLNYLKNLFTNIIISLFHAI